MSSNYFECCPRVNPSDSVPEALSNIIIYNKKQDDEIAKKANKDDLSEVAKSGRYYDLIDKPVALPNPKPITINGQRYDGSEAVTVTVSSEGGGTPVEIDDTLTQSGKAADAKATGDALNALNGANAQQDTEIAKKANADDLAVVAKSGSYNDLNNKPAIPTVPSALPNPNKLKLTGAVTAEYDGSAEVSVEIPAVGGGSYTLPIASPTTLGGVMPAAKTDDMTQAVGVDANGGLWALPGGGGGSGEWKYIRTVTVPENIETDASDINWVAGSNGGAAFGFDTGEDGKPFEYSEIFVRYNQGTYNTTNEIGITLQNRAVPVYGGGMKVPSSGGKSGGLKFGWAYAYNVGGNKWMAQGYWNTGAETGNMQVLRDWSDQGTNKFKALAVGFNVNLNGWGRAAGSTYVFYGR